MKKPLTFLCLIAILSLVAFSSCEEENIIHEHCWITPPEEYNGRWIVRDLDMPIEEKVSTVSISGIDMFFVDLNFSLQHFLQQHSDIYGYAETSDDIYPYILTIYEKGTPRSWVIHFGKTSGDSFLVSVDTPTTVSNYYFFSKIGLEEEAN